MEFLRNVWRKLTERPKAENNTPRQPFVIYTIVGADELVMGGTRVDLVGPNGEHMFIVYPE